MIDLCLESYGAIAHVVDTLLSSGFYLRSADKATAAINDDHHSFDAVVRRSASELEFEQAQAVWLVDVCNSTYAEAATELRIPRDDIALRVAAGRRYIRDALVHVPMELQQIARGPAARSGA